MDNNILMLRLCQIGVILFAALATIAGWGISHYKKKIENTNKVKSQPFDIVDDSISPKYSIHGDLVQGNKFVNEIYPKGEKTSPSLQEIEAVLDSKIEKLQKGIPEKETPYNIPIEFKDNADIRFSAYEGSNDLGYIHLTVTAYRIDDNKRDQVLSQNIYSKEQGIYLPKGSYLLQFTSREFLAFDYRIEIGDEEINKRMWYTLNLKRKN